MRTKPLTAIDVAKARYKEAKDVTQAYEVVTARRRRAVERETDPQRMIALQADLLQAEAQLEAASDQEWSAYIQAPRTEALMDALFDMEPVHRSPAQPKKRWGGHASTKARAIVKRMLPAPCNRCGDLVTDEMDWHADHVHERGQGGQDTPDNYRPAHAHCNTSAGGKIGAAITNGTRVTPAITRERRPSWW